MDQKIKATFGANQKIKVTLFRGTGAPAFPNTSSTQYGPFPRPYVALEKLKYYIPQLQRDTEYAIPKYAALAGGLF